jgi:G3E family GTPase
MIKVDLITGFLGAGKTTFMIEYARHFVNQGKKVAIIVNDHGAINVDRILLQEAVGDSCHLEMVIGGDRDCSRRRMKTKLITMAMEGYQQVLVEPSGIFDVDDLFDLLYEEPLERWYERGNVLTIVDAGLESDLSLKSKYILSTQILKAGMIVISKARAEETEKIEAVKSLIHSCLQQFQCDRKLLNFYCWEKGNITEEDFRRLSGASYRSAELAKPVELENQDFDSVFFFHVKTPITSLKETVEKMMSDPNAGNIFRLKGFIKDDQGQWLEVNATKQETRIRPISIGQELFIVIGEDLNEEVIGSYWDDYQNE